MVTKRTVFYDGFRYFWNWKQKISFLVRRSFAWRLRKPTRLLRGSIWCVCTKNYYGYIDFGRPSTWFYFLLRYNLYLLIVCLLSILILYSFTIRHPINDVSYSKPRIYLREKNVPLLFITKYCAHCSHIMSVRFGANAPEPTWKNWKDSKRNVKDIGIDYK